ncbi:MAG: ECF-type sigma factor [Gemmataceae bacterium]
MTSDRSVTGWVQDLQGGDAQAAQHLWERYFREMARLAEKRLPPGARRAFDEEDIALSAFKSFCNGVEEGRFSRLSAREDLWKILVTLTARKAQAYKRNATRQKRGGGKVLGESDLPGDTPAFETIIGSTPSPAFAVEIAEQFTRLLDQLADDEQRQIALLKMEGHTIEEIATRLNLSHRAVERRLQAIRQTWDQEPNPS